MGWFRPRRTRRSRRRGQGSGGARPRSGRRALRSASGSTNTVGGGDSLGSGTRFLRSRNGLAVRSSWPEIPVGGQARVGCRSSLRRGRGRHRWGSRCTGRRGQSHGATTPNVGGHDLHDPRRPGKSRRRCSCHPRQMFQGAYVTVTQRVEDILQLTPGGSDRADVAASASRVGDARSRGF